MAKNLVWAATVVMRSGLIAASMSEIFEKTIAQFLAEPFLRHAGRSSAELTNRATYAVDVTYRLVLGSAVIVLSDHGQTRVHRVARAGDPLRHEPDTVVAASNRAAHVYRTGAAAPTCRQLAERVEREASTGVVLFRDDDVCVARREGAELVLRETAAGIQLEGDRAILDHPDGAARSLAALRCPNAGDVVVSAAAGWEFADLGGRHHLGGGSHGSLDEGDSLVPVLAVGLGGELPASIVDVAPRVLAHFGVEAPAYTLRRAA